MRLVLRRVVSGYIGKIRRAITDSLARELPTSLPFSPPSLGLPLSFRSHRPYRRTRVRVFVPITTLLHFLRWIALCSGRSTETGTLGQPIRRLVRARPLTSKRRKSPRVHIPAWSTVRDRLRLLDRADTWDTSANTAIYDDTVLHVSRDVHRNLRIPLRTVKWKRITAVISQRLYFNYSFVCAFGEKMMLTLNFSVYNKSRKKLSPRTFSVICLQFFDGNEI